MSAPFVTTLRTAPGTVRLEGGEPRLTVRVEVAELWDAVRVDAPASEPVAHVTRRALEALGVTVHRLDEWVTKLHGFEVLDEAASLREAGAIDGSIFLVMYRRRRPVR